MENSSDTSAQASAKYLKSRSSLLKLVQSGIHSYFNYELDENAGILKINLDGNNYQISDQHLFPALQILKIFDDKQNKKNEDINRIRQKVMKAKASFKKTTQEYIKKISKSKGLDHAVLEHYNKFLSFSPLYNNLHNIQTLPALLLNIDMFKGYGSCQILVHEKGTQNAQNFSYSVNEGTTHQTFEAKKFNRTFSLIKKSKSRLFSQITSFQENISNLGTFLAKEFAYSKHNIVFIMSRNDFLQPLPKEIQYFDQLAISLFPLIESILLTSKIDQKLNHILMALDNFSYPMAIINRNSEILFANSLFEKNMLKDHFFEISLSEGNQLIVIAHQEAKKTADRHHFERISLLGELLNTLRHELSNPLFGLSLANNLLDEDQTNEEIEETLEDISSNSQRCQTIIKNFTNLYQDESEFTEINLMNTVRESATLTKSETRGLSVKISTENISNDENILIYSNPTWISQILFNLIINSSQALRKNYSGGAKDTPYIEILVKKYDESIYIEVIDNGKGIPPKNIENVFHPFFTTKKEGTGLGLSILQKLGAKT